MTGKFDALVEDQNPEWARSIRRQLWPSDGSYCAEPISIEDARRLLAQAEQTLAEVGRLQQGLRALHAEMTTFATAKPGGQQVRTKSAREIVEHFAYKLFALLAAPDPPELEK